MKRVMVTFSALALFAFLTTEASAQRYGSSRSGSRGRSSVQHQRGYRSPSYNRGSYYRQPSYKRSGWYPSYKRSGWNSSYRTPRYYRPSYRRYPNYYQPGFGIGFGGRNGGFHFYVR